MPYLLNLVYLALIVILSPWLVYSAVRKGKYREGYAAKLFGQVPLRPTDSVDVPADRRECVWLHAVSVGEVNLLATTIERLRCARPDVCCVVSTTTMTGYALAVIRYADLTVFYCPLDFSWAVRRAMRRIQPDLLVLAELELWPNLIRAAREHGAKIAIINGRLSDDSYRGYGYIRPLIAWLLRDVDVIAAQDDQTAERFLALGARRDSVHVTGSLKYDGAETDRDNPATVGLRRLAGITTEDVVFLAGSTGDPEESMALATFQQLAPSYPNLRLILVPRQADRFDAVATMLQDAGVRFMRRSRLESGGADPHARVLLVDAIGELGAWWGTATVAYVGGSMSGRGGQNMIEPAAYGAAVAFGPDTRNFRDVVASLLAVEAAVVVEDGAELTTFVRRCLAEPGWAAALGRRSQSLVESQLGGTNRTIRLIAELLDRRTSPAPRARTAA